MRQPERTVGGITGLTRDHLVLYGYQVQKRNAKILRQNILPPPPPGEEVLLREGTGSVPYFSNCLAIIGSILNFFVQSHF